MKNGEKLFMLSEREHLDILGSLDGFLKIGILATIVVHRY